MINREKIAKIEAASDEALRFIQKASLWISRLKADHYIYATKEGAACKRASMDLTRALADLRRGRKE